VVALAGEVAIATGAIQKLEQEHYKLRHHLGAKKAVTEAILGRSGGRGLFLGLLGL
jgi:hypothetical protein